MRLITIILLSIIFFQGCTFKSFKNEWQYNSSNAFNSYTKNFLLDENELAKSDLQRAIKYAKQSADLEQLARVYLGACALNISVEQDYMCEKYLKIEEFVSSKELKAYFLMLVNKEQKEQIKYLPKQYQNFIEYKSLQKYDLAFKSIKSMSQISSQFIAASLIKDKLDKYQVEFLINKASFYGYKKIVLFWLDHYSKIHNDLKEKEKLIKKIKILRN